LHEPVLLAEVKEGLAVKPGQVVVDATIGSGGHTEMLLEIVGIGGRIIGLDRDPEAVKRCQGRFRAARDGVTVRQAAFSKVGDVLSTLDIDKVDGILFDLGVSSEQLETSDRGFSFAREGPLDMRMDKGLAMSAADVLREASERELADILWQFGEERFSRRIARQICRRRSQEPLQSTTQLATLVARVLRRRGRRHPATRTFQALRIYVNDELGELRKALIVAVDRLRIGSRAAVISYHSLEDRIAKETFKKFKAEKIVRWINKKPIVPSRAEIERNPSARSAKLRIIERLTA